MTHEEFKITIAQERQRGNYYKKLFFIWLGIALVLMVAVIIT